MKDEGLENETFLAVGLGKSSFAAVSVFFLIFFFLDFLVFFFCAFVITVLAQSSIKLTKYFGFTLCSLSIASTVVAVIDAVSLFLIRASVLLSASCSLNFWMHVSNRSIVNCLMEGKLFR